MQLSYTDKATVVMCSLQYCLSGCFSSALIAAEAVLRSRELQGAVGNLYYNTALSEQPYLGYGAVNIALNFSCTAPGWPAYAVNNLAKLVVAFR
jgi:hypothetical protein